MNLTKTKKVLLSLKPKVDCVLSSNLVYKSSFSHCKMSYIGYKCRHLKTKIGEPLQNRSYQNDLCHAMKHTMECDYKNPNSSDFKILKKYKSS